MQHPDLPSSPVPPEAGLESGPPTGFTDVFISYSRKDKAFVQQLSAALTASKRNVWVDWNDILPSEDFLQSIYAGIDAADTFMFVMSPDSISSEVCFKEVSHAVQSKKRIIPVVCREVNAKIVFEPLQPLNWIDFSKEGAFPVAFGQLIFALETDLDYWHRSARLLARARQWEKKQERSLTLRGKELKEAERWQQEGATKKPPPGPPVTTFIAASIKQRTRSRVLSGVLALIFLLTAAGGVYLYINPILNPNLVSNLNDTGPGSLRLDVEDAKPGTKITFAPNLNGSIILTKSLSIPRDVIVEGPGAEKVSIASDVGSHYPVIIESSSTSTISGVTFHTPIENQGVLTLNKIVISDILLPCRTGDLTVLDGSISNSGTLTLSDSTITNNDLNVCGSVGGIYNNDGNVRISNSTISKNRGNNAGGIYSTTPDLEVPDKTGWVIISNSTIASNSPAASGSGGGIHVENHQKLIISNSTIADNTADGVLPTWDGGGGIYAKESTVIISNSTIAGNLTSLNGGGIVNWGGFFVISNSTIFGNNAVNDGAGIYNITTPDGQAEMGIIFSTVYRNQAGVGGALAAVELNDTGEIPPTDVYVELDNSIVVDNQSDSGPDITGTLTTGGYNLFQNFDKSALLFDDHYHRQATDQIVTDLSFIGNQLQNVNGPDGKPVPTQMLPLINTPGNPAIDAIPPGNRCPVPPSPLKDAGGIELIDPFTNTALTLNTDHDQRGVARPFGPGCDIGAYEYNGA